MGEILEIRRSRSIRYSVFVKIFKQRSQGLQVANKVDVILPVSTPYHTVAVSSSLDNHTCKSANTAKLTTLPWSCKSKNSHVSFRVTVSLASLALRTTEKLPGDIKHPNKSHKY